LFLSLKQISQKGYIRYWT